MKALDNVKMGLSNASVSIRKHSPEILQGIGIIGVVTATVLACKATLKVNDIFEEHNEDMDKIKSTAADESKEDYTEQDAKTDTVKRYAMTAGKLVKAYAPAGIVLGGSICCLCKSTSILKKRNAGLAAAYTAVSTAFSTYRENVIDRFGNEVDFAMRHGLKAEQIEETEVDSKGKEKIVKKDIVVAHAPNNEYVRYLTKANANWRGGNEDYITMFLRGQQNWANDLLRSRKYTSFPCVTFNEVLQMLDFDPCNDGMVTGWNARSATGDGFIQFTVNKVNILNELGEYEVAYAIDFNVDGLIYEE